MSSKLTGSVSSAYALQFPPRDLDSASVTLYAIGEPSFQRGQYEPPPVTTTTIQIPMPADEQMRLARCIETLKSRGFTGPNALRLLKLCDWEPERALAVAEAADWNQNDALELADER